MFRNVRTPDLVLLWARAAGMCSHPECKIRLVLEGGEDDAGVAVGEAAHIVARSAAGPRGDARARGWQKNGYSNLILLCGFHHGVIDRQPELYTVEDLRGWKAEHEAWVRETTRRGGQSLPWTAIVQDAEGRIDLGEAREALGAGNVVERLVELRSRPERDGWEAAAREEREAVERALAEIPPERRRFAVFSMGRIPLAMQLGFVLGDRARAAVQHYDRDRGSWRWGARMEGRGGVEVRTRGGKRRAAEAALRVSLSAAVPAETGVKAGIDVEVAAERPSVRWLRSEEQLAELARAYEGAMARIRESGARRVHVFYAGPGAGAVALGRAMHARMDPEAWLYEYRRGRYELALRLNDE